MSKKNKNIMDFTQEPVDLEQESLRIPKKKKAKKKGKRVARWLVIIPLIILAIFICIGSVGFVIIAECSKDLPNVEKLKFYSPSETTKIYAVDGTVLATLYKENREWVAYNKIPKDMINAIIATEDSRFYSHKGVSAPDIIRAVVINFRKKGTSQGASTITQQLARNIFLFPETNMRRKIREAILAVQIEKKFTKQEILELYLNQIYFGAGAYGIQAAAKTYFGKDITKLTLAECAVIAGLPAAPSNYSPFVQPQDAKFRQILVLKRMYDLGYINYDTMKRAVDQKLEYAKKNEAVKEEVKYPYFTTFAMHELFQKYSDDLLYRGGLKIYTTIDVRLQKLAEATIKKGLASADAQGLNCHQAAMVVIEPKTGFIKAMVGGNGWNNKNQFNRAWQARRQPGSSFKIFVYTTAIDSGFTPDSIVLDSPISFPDGDSVWAPKNSDGRYLGAIPLRVALKLSRNVAAVRMMERLGPERVVQYAYKMGIKDQLEPNLSLALGSGVVTPLDMTSAVSVLANEGIRVEPTTIKKIVDSEGNVIEDNSIPTQETVISATTAFAMTEMMQDVILSGTGTNANIGRPAAGKTGTTDSFRDAWFVGFTPEYACAVWTGNDDYQKMNYAFGGNIPATIWGEFMKAALKGVKIQQFKKPTNDNVALLICNDSGLRANTGCPRTHKEFYRPGKEPRRFCNLHGERGGGGGATDDKPVTSKPRPVMTKEPDEPEIHEEDLTPPPDFTPKGNAGAEPAPKEQPEEIEAPPPAPAEPAKPDGQVEL